jgi:hypothetical protein
VLIVLNAPGAFRFLEEWALGARPGGVCEYKVNRIDHREQARASARERGALVGGGTLQSPHRRRVAIHLRRIIVTRIDCLDPKTLNQFWRN